MSKQYLMALDAGGGAGRCFLVSTDGDEAFSAYREWSYTQPEGVGPLGSCFDADVFWSILAETARAAIAKAGIKGEQVIAVSATSQRHGAVFLDAQGKELYAGPNRDYRAVLEGMQLASQFGEQLYQRSGHFPDAMFCAARLLWQRNHAPEVFARIAHVLSIGDWVAFRLSGEYASEPSSAGETCLFDLAAGEWMGDVLGALELGEELFPPLRSPGTVIGEVGERVAQETGLACGTPVVVGGADTQCGLLGSGAIGPGEMGAISGTTTPVQMVTEQPLIDPEVRIWAGAHVVPGLFVLESNAGYSGGVYQWLRDAFCEKELAEEKAGRAEAYNLMNAQAAEAPPGAGGVLSFIGIMLMNAKTTGMPKNVLYMGTSPLTGEGKSTRSLIMRAVLESLAYGVRANAEQIQGVSGRQVENLRVCGGLAKGDLYLEILANVMGVPVLVPRLTEGSGSGAAICAGVGVGVYDGFAEGAKILAKEGKRIEPDERLSRQYKTFYRRWGKTRGELENLSSSF